QRVSSKHRFFSRRNVSTGAIVEKYQNSSYPIKGAMSRRSRILAPPWSPPFLPGGVTHFHHRQPFRRQGFPRGGAIFGPDYVGNRFPRPLPPPHLQQGAGDDPNHIV